MRQNIDDYIMQKYDYRVSDIGKIIRNYRKYNLKKLFNYFPIPTSIISTDTSVVYINHAFEEMFGFSNNDIIGMKFPYPWWTPTVKEMIYSFGGRSTLRKYNRSFEIPFKTSAGGELIVVVTKLPVKYKKKTKFYLVNYFNITELRVVNDAANNMRRIITSIEKNDERGSELFSLTQRQIDVLRLLAYGYSNVAIAQRLNITVKSVECHINNIYQELNVTSDLTHRRVTAALFYFSKWDSMIGGLSFSKSLLI